MVTLDGENMMQWDRFDIVEAYYTYLVDYHEGQYSAKYARLSRILQYFRPAAGWLGRDSLSYNGRDIYDNLVG